MVERALEIGPGSVRVGRFIGRLGVVAMPAIEHGLGLVERVVRRHVAKVAQGLANSRRERAALQGWQASIMAGRYAQVRYLARPAVASRLRRLATDVGLMPAQFIVGERVVEGEPAAPSRGH